MTRIIPATTRNLQPRNPSISAEVNFQRKPIASQQQARFNILTTLGSPTAKPVTRFLALFFFPKGNTRGPFHGVPTILHFIRTEHVPDWQHYLTNQVLHHPAWTTYPNIKQYMIDPDHPICVGFWEGNSNTPNANTLIGSGAISDLLRLTENPKNLAGTQQIPSVRGSHRTQTTFRIAYTVFIRRIGIVYSDEEEASAKPVGGIKQETELKPLVNRTGRCKTASKQPPSDSSESDSEVIICNSTDALPTTPLPPPQIPPTHTPTSSVLAPSKVSRKRSLTLMSPQNITTRCTREIKKIAFVEPRDLDAGSVDTGSSTELDTDSGFQFLTDVD